MLLPVACICCNIFIMIVLTLTSLLQEPLTNPLIPCPWSPSRPSSPFHAPHRLTPVLCCFQYLPASPTIEYKYSMSGREKCSQCMFNFNMAKLPRKLPTCEHSICQPCIRQIIDSRQDMIICGFCSAVVRKEEIHIFPLNTAILLLLSDKTPIMEQPVMNEEENNLMGDLLISSQNLADINHDELCPKHKVVLDIVCISDKQRICPHCALFGPHRDHHFKRLDDFERELREKRHVFQEIQTDKQRVFKGDLSRLNQEFSKQSQIKKFELRSKIESQFRRFQVELRKRKELTFHDLDSAFYDLETQFRTQGPVNKCQAIKQKLNTWQSTCLQSLHKLDVTKRIEDKLSFYYEGPLEIVTQGYIYIEELNKSKEQALRKMADSINDVKVVFQSGKSWFERCSRVVQAKMKMSSSELKELDDETNQVNPFLEMDCTSSEIVIGSNSFLVNNTSLQVEINSIPSPNKNSYTSSKKLFQSPSLGNYTPSRSDLKAVRSTEKERPRMQQQLATQQVRKTPAISPKISSYTAKRPISELSSFKSPSKIVKTLTSIAPKLKEYSFIEQNTSVMSPQCKQPQKIYLQFSKNTLSDFFDISDCNLASDKLVEYVHRARRIHKIRGLKICNNHLTTAGFDRMTQFLQGVSNINASNNQLNGGIFQVIMRNQDRLDSLRVLNLMHNPIVLDKRTVGRMQEVRKLGIIITLQQ